MSDESQKPPKDDIEVKSQRSEPRRPRRVPIIVAIVAMVAIIATAALWLLWPKQAGKPVAAPRTVSFQESPQLMAMTEQRITVTPEQLRSAQLKIETVGEALSTEAAGQMATGVVQ